jgi:isocitrate dehydrogenase
VHYVRKRTYNFRDKDPVCDELANLVDAAGLRGKKNIGKVAMLATVAHGTVDGILYGDTKKPQNATVMAIATAMGFERKWVASADKSWNLEAQLTEARAFIKKERERMAREEAKPRKKKKTNLKLVASR